MTAEQTTFLQVLTDYLNGTKTRWVEPLDWPLLCELAEKHKMGGILYVQARSEIDRLPELSAVWQTLYRSFCNTINHSSKFTAVYERLRAILDQAEISYLPIKGPTVAEYYPDPELRSMSDIDVMVYASDADSIRKLLLADGFCVKQWSVDEWKFAMDSCLIEFQEHLIRSNEDEHPERVRYFDRYWEHAIPYEGSSAFFLDWDFHFLYLIIHISKHLKGHGIGFRQFYDLSVLMKRNWNRLHFDRIRSDAEAIDLFRFTKSCLCLCAHWFGVPSPYGDNVLSRELIDEITDTVFENGVFGFCNEENDMNPLERARRSSRLPLPLLKLREVSRLLFPSYRHLSSAEKYEYLRGRPYLLPYAWAKRLLSRKHREEKTRAITNLIRASKSTVDSRHQRFKELGL